MRKAKGLTQEQLAERSKFTTDYIGRIEAGSKQVPVYTLEILVNALDVPLERLFQERAGGGRRWTSGVRETSGPRVSSGDAEALELIDTIHELDQATLGALVILVRRLRRPR